MHLVYISIIKPEADWKLATIHPLPPLQLLPSRGKTCISVPKSGHALWPANRSCRREAVLVPSPGLERPGTLPPSRPWNPAQLPWKWAPARLLREEGHVAWLTACRSSEQSCLADWQMPTDTWLSLAKTRRAALLSPAHPQNLELNEQLLF